MAVGEELEIQEDEGVLAAREAGLRYVSDRRPGITRRRAGRGFTYRDASGETIRDPETLARIRALAVPPAWTDVWICTSPRGHIQATGRDARGRKQYRYHTDWREVRDQTKYERVVEFGRALPRIRRRVDADLARTGLPREKVVAAVVRLLDTTLVRVGNDEYARLNSSFGMTTLLDDHVEFSGGRIRFSFVGKGGKEHEVEITDRRLAHIVKRCQDLPGEELFQYVSEGGERCVLDSDDVNAYLRELHPRGFTAKDFRTWGGTVLAASALCELGPPSSARDATRKVNEAIRSVAAELNNTLAVCRRCYVHPEVIEAYREGSLPCPELSRARSRGAGARPEERVVLRFLEERLAREAA